MSADSTVAELESGFVARAQPCGAKTLNFQGIESDKPALEPRSEAPMHGLTVDFEHEGVVFRLADGTPVLTHYSFGVIACFVTIPLWLEGRLSSLIVVAAMIAILFVSILAHELGHKAAAERQGASARQMDIAFYGGLTRLEWDQHRGLAMRAVALAGPAVSLGLAGIFFALYWMAMRAGAGRAAALL
jgi:Zn-dependent protease